MSFSSPPNSISEDPQALERERLKQHIGELMKIGQWSNYLPRKTRAGDDVIIFENKGNYGEGTELSFDVSNPESILAGIIIRPRYGTRIEFRAHITNMTTHSLDLLFDLNSARNRLGQQLSNLSREHITGPNDRAAFHSVPNRQATSQTAVSFSIDGAQVIMHHAYSGAMFPVAHRSSMALVQGTSGDRPLDPHMIEAAFMALSGGGVEALDWMESWGFDAEGDRLEWKLTKERGNGYEHHIKILVMDGMLEMHWEVDFPGKENYVMTCSLNSLEGDELADAIEFLQTRIDIYLAMISLKLVQGIDLRFSGVGRMGEADFTTTPMGASAELLGHVADPGAPLPNWKECCVADIPEVSFASVRNAVCLMMEYPRINNLVEQMSIQTEFGQVAYFFPVKDKWSSVPGGALKMEFVMQFTEGPKDIELRLLLKPGRLTTPHFVVLVEYFVDGAFEDSAAAQIKDAEEQLIPQGGFYDAIQLAVQQLVEKDCTSSAALRQLSKRCP